MTRALVLVADCIKLGDNLTGDGRVFRFAFIPTDPDVAALTNAPKGAKFQATFVELDEVGNPRLQPAQMAVATSEQVATQSATSNAAEDRHPNTSTNTTEETTTEKPAGDASPSEQKPRRVSYAKEAAIKCHDLGFQNFLAKEYPQTVQFCFDPDLAPVDLAAKVVRHICKVDSRSEFLAGTPAGNRWELLAGECEMWKRGE